MYVTPKEAAKYHNVTENCLRNWSIDGRIKYTTTKGGHRRYLLEEKTEECVVAQQESTKLSIIYTRVSSKKQQGDLERQTKYLKEKYPNHTSITDVGSGINFQRPGFRRILEGVFKGTIQQVVVAHRDRFTRFGYDIFEWIFQQHGAELIYDKEQEGSSENEMAEDLLAIITVFAARHHGRRKYNY